MYLVARKARYTSAKGIFYAKNGVGGYFQGSKPLTRNLAFTVGNQSLPQRDDGQCLRIARVQKVVQILIFGRLMVSWKKLRDRVFQF